MIIILDFGGQYSQLIARRIRECNVYCEIYPYNWTAEEIKLKNPDGIIFSGGPNSVYSGNAAKCSKQIYELGVPILGICYGAQFIACNFGGDVKPAAVAEYRKTIVNVDNDGESAKKNLCAAISP